MPYLRMKCCKLFNELIKIPDAEDMMPANFWREGHSADFEQVLCQDCLIYEDEFIMEE